MSGTQDNHYWFAKDTGLLVQAKIKTGDYDSNMANGAIAKNGIVVIEYKGHAEFILTSLTPIPLPMPVMDAGPDAM